MSVKTELCNFSGFKIYPGHGRRFVRTDSKTFIFITAKSECAFKNKTNPRKVKWTQVYRRVHKKGTTQESQKKRVKRVVKVQRDIVGATVEQIRQKKAQRPEIRVAAREAALREIKERKAKKAGSKTQKPGAKTTVKATKKVRSVRPANKGR